MNLTQQLALWLILPILLPAASPAYEFVSTNTFSLPAGTVIQEPTFVAATSASVQGVVSDDFFIAANDLRIEGECANDLWAAASTIELNGSVRDHVRAMGHMITVRGWISNSLAAAASSIQLTETSVVSGGANLVAEGVVLSGSIAGRTRIAAERVTLSGTFGDSVRIIANDIVILPGTVIRGNLVYTSPDPLVLDSKVTLDGELLRQEAQGTAGESAPGTAPGFLDVLASQGYFFGASFLAGATLFAVFPGLVGRAARNLRYSGLKCSFAGLLGLFLLPTFAMFCFVTLLGIPLALLIMTFYASVLYLAKAVVALAVGAAILRIQGELGLGQAIGALVVGLAILYGIGFIPVFGAVVWTATTLIGMGALLTAMLRRGGSQPPPLPG